MRKSYKKSKGSLSETIELLGLDCLVHYNYIITSFPTKDTGPSYSSGGEPGDPLEFDITITKLESITPKGMVELELNEWLKAALYQYLMVDDDIAYQAVGEDCEEDDREYERED